MIQSSIQNPKMKVSTTIKASLYVLSIIVYSTSLFSQALVKKTMNYNLALINRPVKSNTQSTFRSSSIADTIAIGTKGIIDDFSYPGPDPDSSLWFGNQVYVNRGYPISPMSIGVATFDGLDARGYPYNFLAGVSSQPADTLASKPIDLSSSDSVYFSFYYQPQGLGNSPEAGDSLVLEFKGPKDTVWGHIWSMPGSALTSSDTSFNLVMIPITKPSYLQRGFQFRFRNYASIDANADQWHIDYIYLNAGRNYHDTVFADVAWVYEGASLLKNYRAMPWRQYTSAEILTSTNNLIRNNDTVVRSLNYHYQTLNIITSSVFDVFNGASNINPFTTNKIYTDCNVSLGCINSISIDASKFPSSLTGPSMLGIKHYYSSNLLGDFIPRNDTLLVVGNFSNYFAYDDGTAESEVGLIGALNGQMAVQFKLNVADTLGALDLYFSPFITNASLYGFYLNVWSDYGGKPGSLIYKSDTVSSPIYEKKGQNVFARYYFKPMLLSPGTYYAGFTQAIDSSLNIGLDLNDNSQNTNFMNLANGSGWQTSTIAGAWMMRPIMGNVVNPNGINQYTALKTTLEVFPNPSTDKLYIKSPTFTDKVNYEIIDVFGKAVLEGNFYTSDYIDISGLSEGIYFIRVVSGTEIAANKFIKIN